MRTRMRPLSTSRFLRARAAALVALTLLVGLAVPVAEASPLPPPAAGPAGPAVTEPAHRVDVGDPGAAGLTVRQPRSESLYRVVEIAPGIGVTDQVSPEEAFDLHPDGTVLSEDGFQLLADRISSVIEQIRRTPTGDAALKAIPHLLAPTAKNVWTAPQTAGEALTSRVQIVFAEGAGVIEDSNGQVPLGKDLTGGGSLITLGGATWYDEDATGRAYIDPSTGEARMLTPEQTIQHELMHAIADLGEAMPARGRVQVPTAAWTSWPIAGDPDVSVEVGVEFDEIFTQGGPRGLTAARSMLLSPGPNGAPPQFTPEEFPSISIDPWFLRAQRQAMDRFTAADTPASEREGWLRAAAARLSMAMNPPRETTFSRESGLPGRAEYHPSGFVIGDFSSTTIRISVTGGQEPWKAADLRQRADVVPLRGTWERPILALLSEVAPSRAAEPDGSSESSSGHESDSSGHTSDSSDDTGRSSESGSSDGGSSRASAADRAGGDPESLPSVRCSSCGGTVGRALPAEEAEAFEARVASEVSSAFEGPRAVQRRVLADPVGDAVRQVHGPGLASGVWSRYPKLVAGLQKAPLRLLTGTDGVGAGGIALDVMGLLRGDTSALSIANTTTDIMTSIAPMLGVRIANTIGGAGAVVGFITSTIAFTQGGSETEYIFSMVGLLMSMVPELAPLMVLYMVVSIFSQSTPIEEGMNAGQQMAVAFKDWALPALEKQANAMADSMRDVASDRMEEARYRADYLQTKVDLDQLAEGHDLTTGGGDGGSQEQKRVVREETDQELSRIASAGAINLDQGLDALLEEYNNGAVFTEFRQHWADTMNEDGGVSINGIKHHVDLNELPTTNPTPVHVDEFTTPLGSIRTIMQSRYRHALDALPLWTPSRNAFATPMVTEETVLASVPKVQRDWGFTGPPTTSAAPVDSLTAFTGTGTPGSFVQVWNTTTKDLACGATKVNTVGLWVCRPEKGFQEPGISSTYELHSSTVDTGGFASTGKTVTVTTTGKAKPEPVVEWGADLHVEGRTVTGTVTAGAVVQLQTMPQDSIDTTKNGLPVSDPVTAADGHFTLTARPDAPGGSTRLVATFKDHVIAERIVLDGGPTAPARVPESVEDSPVHILHLTATSIEGVVPAGQSVQLRLGEDPALPSVATDTADAFRLTFDRPLPNPQTITLRSWPADKPWQQSTRTVVWTGDTQQPSAVPDVRVH
ncbi:hypothetical protein [Rathayibacter sp. VKM Ac-2857]|uniref:hypothetical protein n=1 Tax=Rathayibacter sp. VKM Ac-2857 TaxID=2739020 RepID=UPI001564FC4E|nr:hypothetical protein [Rathayibacter sp. VKM Ac-2857]NQX16288.1 hypothetical protein [Rathayibacter sp. VKM Ac-2857]